MSFARHAGGPAGPGEANHMAPRQTLALVALLVVAAAAAYVSTTSRDVVLASFATSLAGRTPAQRANALRAAAAVDGVVVPPGGHFSFNGRVGSLSRDRGYLKAPVSFDGELVPSFGGGVCQTSTTVYNAALLAGMDVTERHRHVWPPAYAARGDDAAVAYPRIDLAFTNPLRRPVRLTCRQEGERLLCELHSAQRSPYTYEVQHQVRSFTRAPLVRQAGAEPGRRPVRRLVKGRAGFAATTVRLTYREGQLVAREIIAEDAYQPLPEVIQANVDPGVGP